MSKIKEVLRLKWVCGLSMKSIAGTCSLARSSVSKYVQRAEAAGLTWQIVENMSEEELERQVIYSPSDEMKEIRVKPDWHNIHNQLKRKGVTLHLLWEEYKSDHPQGLQYSQFCQIYRDWRKELDLPMHQDHKAGEKMFVDYCGQTMPVKDLESGECHQSQIFVAVLGASNYTYAEASWGQSLQEWVLSHEHAFQYFGGVPDQIIPDNLKSGVTVASRYEPEINRTYEELARHYGCAIIPARVRKPKDKAKVEKGVQDVGRRILAPLRNMTFFTLFDLNEAIKDLLIQYNERPFQKIPGTRRSLFLEMEHAALKSLPQNPYDYAEWERARVNIDYHFEMKGHFYSVPYQFVHQSVDVRVSLKSIECFHKNKRVASHLRSTEKGKYTTITEHMPKRHQDYAKWTPERLLQWAMKTGPETTRVVEHIMASRPHPQQGFRACLGLMRLGKEYGPERLESACGRAWVMNVVGFKSIDSILKRNLDMQPIPEKIQARPPLNHDNIRGPEYYR